jgi:uncharacterized membrane protein YraQ (UPF0718 family)
MLEGARARGQEGYGALFGQPEDLDKVSAEAHGAIDQMSGAGLVALSVVMLMVGPLVFRFTNRSKRALAVLDGFILTSIAGLLLAHVLPEALRVAGPMALGAMAFGAMIPMLFERLSKSVKARANVVLWVFALGGFVLHTLLDGVALGLQSAQGEDDHALALAVILHRLPVGLALWWLVKPRWGRGWASGLLAIEGLVTIMGYMLGPEVVLHLDRGALALLQATVAGSLLHVMIHHRPEETHAAHAAHTARLAPAAPAMMSGAVRLKGLGPGVTFSLVQPPAAACGHVHANGACCDHDHSHAASLYPGLETLGAALGVALVCALPFLEPHDHDYSHHALSGWTERFLHLGLESAPALLLGLVLAGVVSEFLPRFSQRWLGGGGDALGRAARGVVFGAPIPLCSCGVVPLYKTLIKRGVPASAAMAFLVATPELGVESILLSLPLLGVELTAARLVAALVVALLVGWLLGGRIKGQQAANTEEEKRTDRPLGERIRAAARFGLVDVVDDSAAWIVAGLLAASMLATDMMPHWLAGLPSAAGVFAFALLGMPLYVCASGATPLAAALIFAGASPGAALAFLIAGPATNVTTLGMLRQTHGPGVGVKFGAMVVGLACIAGLVTDQLVGTTSVVPQHAHGNEHVGWWSWACLVAVTGIFAGSLWRRGPRAMMMSLMESGGHA